MVSVDGGPRCVRVLCVRACAGVLFARSCEPLRASRWRHDGSARRPRGLPSLRAAGCDRCRRRLHWPHGEVRECVRCARMVGGMRRGK
eukprot:86966-Prymnesium_polylepis.1